MAHMQQGDGLWLPVHFDYDAVKATTRRKNPPARVRAEHHVLPERKRDSLMATVQDQIRNAALCAWMIRRHLDYVSKFRIGFRTGNEGLDKLVTRIFKWHAQPRHFDVAARFGREEMFRMFEAEKVGSGDAGMTKITRMLKLQAVESDLIKYPKCGRWDRTKKQHVQIPTQLAAQVDADTGAVMDPSMPGRVAKWCICNRGPKGDTYAYDHLEPAENVIFDAYYARFSSQVRGVSPLSTAVNLIQDSYEGIDYNLAKAKVHALFGIALMRDYAGAGSDQEEVDQFGPASGINTGADEQKASATETDGGTEIIAKTMQNMSPQDMLMVDMDLKGRIDTIESKTPSTEFREFQELVIRLSLLALDIPYSAMDSRAASFSGLIADANLYEVSCRWKREKNQWKRREYSDWLLESIWNDPRDADVNAGGWGLKAEAQSVGIRRLRELQEEIEWVPSGAPWLQKLQEIQGDTRAIAIGADNPIDVCKRRGTDFFDNVDKIEAANTYAKDHGVTLMIGEPGQATISQVAEPESRPEGDE